MLCNEFKCVYKVINKADEWCETDGNQCDGDLCEVHGECNGCIEWIERKCEGL